MKTLQIVGVIVVLGILLYLVYKFTIGKKDSTILSSNGRNDKDLTKLTFTEANNFCPTGRYKADGSCDLEPIFSFSK